MSEHFTATRESTTLEIVWQNPKSAAFNPQTIEQLVNDDYKVVYAARGADRTTVFELIRRRLNESATDFSVDDPLHKTRARIEELMRKIR